VLFKAGKFTPLNEIATHYANHGTILPQQTPCTVYKMHMSVMQGVKFADDADYIQKITPIIQKTVAK
jgi:hypothetical protein